MGNEIEYCINEPHVISELIDNEVIILNFKSGTYYSLNESGMMIWQGIQDGRSQTAILALLIQRYSGENEALKSDLAELLKTLQTEQLIVPTVEAVLSDIFDIPENMYPVVGYEKPILQKFDDLQNLLLLDPIHDVDEMGWPVQT